MSLVTAGCLVACCRWLLARAVIAVGQAQLAGLLGSVVDSRLPKNQGSKYQGPQGSRQNGWLAAGTFPPSLGGAPPLASPLLSALHFSVGLAWAESLGGLWSVPAAATADPLEPDVQLEEVGHACKQQQPDDEVGPDGKGTTNPIMGWDASE